MYQDHRTGDGGPGEKYADGAAYSPARNSWRPIPASPLTARAGAAAAWAERTLVVWGGTNSRIGDIAPPVFDLTDGATYDPATNSWQTMPPLPSAIAAELRTPGRQWSYTAEAVGRWFVLLSDDPAQGSVVFDTASGAWSTAPTRGMTPTRAFYFTSSSVVAVASAGDPLVGASCQVSRWTPGDDAWESLPSVKAKDCVSLPTISRGGSRIGLWTDQRFVSTLTPRGAGAGWDEDNLGSTWNPDTGDVDVIDHGRRALSAAEINGEPVLIGADRGYVVDRREWVDLEPPTVPIIEGHSVWTGREILNYYPHRGLLPAGTPARDGPDGWRFGPPAPASSG